MKVKEVPVYLFLGFLEGGKTKFIQETMEDARFESGDKTLLLVLEEGEEEYVPSRFAVKDFWVEYVDAEELSVETLSAISEKYDYDRVLVEYNGMKPVEELFEAMPDGWMINQVMTFFDATTFLLYNQNMRQLVFDKIQYAQLVVFNRFLPSYDTLAFHKIVRAITRRADIIYEDVEGNTQYDEIEDELPFSLDVPLIELNDRDYAYFYRDLMEDMQKYHGKVVRLKGLVATDKRLKRGTIVLGRHIMTCCEADITYSGLVALYNGDLPFKTRDWVKVTARIDLEYHGVYEQKGPILKIKEIERCEAPQEELATFY